MKVKYYSTKKDIDFVANCYLDCDLEKVRILKENKSKGGIYC
jgi:hypothetical protein